MPFSVSEQSLGMVPGTKIAKIAGLFNTQPGYIMILMWDLSF